MNIIFVCTGNTCRSPMAEYYLKSKNLNNISVVSRGFSGGDKANKNSIAVMNEVGIDISNHISVYITPTDIKNADTIICMTESHKQMLLLSGADQNKLYVLGGGIPDPFGCDIETYRQCRDSIFENIDNLIDMKFFKQIKIQIATTDNISDIAKIEQQSFSIPWSEKSILESMNSGTDFYVALVGDTVAGYIGVSKIAGEGYVTNIAVLPEYRNQGVGTKILEFVIEDCRQTLEFISLEVRASNAAAIHLYENFGFKHVGLRKCFYTNPTEDAIIMTKHFI